MKSNSIVNLLTAVMFSLVTVFSHVGFGADCSKFEGKAEKCVEVLLTEKCKSLTSNAESEQYTQCTKEGSSYRETIKSTCTDMGCQSTSEAQGDRKEKREQCQKAVDKMLEKSADFLKACAKIKNPEVRQNADANNSLFSTNTNDAKPIATIQEYKDCNTRVDQCRNMMSASSSAKQADPNSVDNILKTVMSVKDPQALQQYEAATNSNQQANANGTTPSCVKFSNKDIKEQKKSYEIKIKELKEKKEKLEKEFYDEMAEQNKKNAEITKKIEELQTSTKEKNRQSDAKLREQNTSNQKNSIEYTKKARDVNNKIISKQVQLKKMQFDYANRLASESAEKVAMQCQAVLNKAQECLIKSIKLKATVSDDCKNFPVLATKRGAAATAELKTKMKYISDQCYQEADTSKKNAAYAQQDAIDQINRDIQNMQQDLQDLQNNINIESNNSAKIQQEAQREQDENAQSVAQQTQNFNNELQSFFTTSKQKQENLTQKTNQILREMEEAEFEFKTGEESAISTVEDIMSDSESLKKIAENACNCDKADKQTQCSALKDYEDRTKAGIKGAKTPRGKTGK